MTSYTIPALEVFFQNGAFGASFKSTLSNFRYFSVVQVGEDYQYYCPYSKNGETYPNEDRYRKDSVANGDCNYEKRPLLAFLINPNLLYSRVILRCKSVRHFQDRIVHEKKRKGYYDCATVNKLRL
jgi:hypothetical protein